MRSNTPDSTGPEPGPNPRQDGPLPSRGTTPEGDPRSAGDRQVAARRSEPPRAPGLVVEGLLDVGTRGSRWLVRLDGDGRSLSATDPANGPVWTARGRPPDRLVLRLAAGTVGTPATPSGHLDEELRALDAAVLGLRRPEPDAWDPRGSGPPAGRIDPSPGPGDVPAVVDRHLVRTWGHVVTSHGPGLLIEAEEAVPLGQVLADRGVVTVGEVSTLLTPIAELAAHLHEAGVAHGDLGPAMILVAVDGRPILAELGDAQLLGHAPAGAGTPETLAPERRAILAAADPAARGEAFTAGQSPAADVHALGAAAWTALAGTPPGTQERVALTVLAPQTPAAVADLIASALAEAPEERPSARDFAAELYRAAAPQPLEIDGRLIPRLPESADSSPGGEAASAAGRRLLRRLRTRGVLVGGAAALVVIAVVLGGVLWRGVNPSGPAEEADGGSGSEDVEAAETGDPRDSRRRQALRDLRRDDVAAALEGVAALRTLALRDAGTSTASGETGEPGAHGEAVAAYAWSDSPAAREERRMLAAMSTQHLSYVGRPVAIEPLAEPEELTAREGEAARRAVDAEVRAADFVPADGATGADSGAGAGAGAEHAPERTEPLAQHVRLTMVRRDGVWKLQEVRTMSGAGSADAAEGTGAV